MNDVGDVSMVVLCIALPADVNLRVRINLFFHRPDVLTIFNTSQPCEIIMIVRAAICMTSSFMLHDPRRRDYPIFSPLVDQTTT